MKNTGLHTVCCQRTYLILFILCLFACKSKNPESQNNVIQLEEVWDTKGTVMLTEIASSIEYIPLLTSSDKESLLPAANKIKVVKAGSYFVIYGRELAVKVFSGQGDYIRTIGGIGKGPGEYSRVTKVLVTPEGNGIWIIDINSNRLINYSIKGILMNDYKLERNLSQVSIDSKGNLYIMYLEYDINIMDSSKIEVINKDGETLDQFPLYTGRRFGPGSKYRLFSRLFFNDGAIEHFEPPYDTLFRYEDKAWKPVWILDVGSNNLPFEAYIGDRFNEISQPYSFISSLLETQDYFFIRGVHKQYSKLILADKNSLLVKNCDDMYDKLERSYMYKGLTNDIDGGVPFWPRSSYQDEYLISLINPMDLIDFEPAIGDPSSFAKGNREKLDYLMKNVDPEGNPILMLVKRK